MNVRRGAETSAGSARWRELLIIVAAAVVVVLVVATTSYTL